MSAAVASADYSHAAGCVVSTDPLVVVSRHQLELPCGLASIVPQHFEAKPSLHFLGPTWSAESPYMASAIAAGFAAARERLPKARFIILANTSAEVTALAEVGVASFLANELMFLDEGLLTPQPAIGASTYDAVYNARLLDWKRHELAQAVSKLLLIYPPPEGDDLARVRNILPQAVFANHDLNGGTYRLCDETGVCKLLRRASVGLCLSETEGAMRASLEYRLCGLPVVSTRSIGGRDRYFLGPHVRVVDDDPEAVARAVADLKAQKFHPLAVREFVGQLVAFDRHNFVLAINKIVEKEFGARDRFKSFRPFLRYPAVWRKLEEVLAPLEAQVRTA